MRFREINSLIKQYSEIIKALTVEPISGSNNVKVNNWIKAYSGFDILEETGIFSHEVKRMKSLSNLYLTRIDSFIIDISTNNQLNDILQNISKKIELFNAIYTVTQQDQDTYTASFKLYEFNSFSDYVALCNDLNTKILNPLNRIHEECLLGEMESGSKWFSIVFKTSLAMSLFFGIVRISFDCLIHDYQTYRVTKNLIESLELSKDAIQEFNQKMHEQNDANISSQTEKLFTEVSSSNPEAFATLDDGEKSEMQNSLIISVNLLMKHIDKGLEIYEALDKPKNERYELPDYKQLMLVKAEQKKITQ